MNGTNSTGKSRSEERLVRLYMELTGASESQARGVYAHLESAHDQEDGGKVDPPENLPGPLVDLPFQTDGAFAIRSDAPSRAARARSRISSGFPSAETEMSKLRFS